GFSDSSFLRVYDVSDSLNPVRLVGAHREYDGEYHLRFQDSLFTGETRTYVVTERPHPLPLAKFSPVTRRRLTARGTGDYLLIVPEAFLPAAATLQALRESQGLTVVVSPTESVFDEFNGGRRSSYAIKRFIRYAFNNWGSRFVMLLGDGSEDPLNLLNS